MPSYDLVKNHVLFIIYILSVNWVSIQYDNLYIGH